MNEPDKKPAKGSFAALMQQQSPPSPSVEEYPPATGEATGRPEERPTRRPPDEATTRRGDRATGRGELIRRGFEWYADQLRALKKLSLEEQLRGGPGSMSAMVREALDEYLKKRASET